MDELHSSVPATAARRGPRPKIRCLAVGDLPGQVVAERSQRSHCERATVVYVIRSLGHCWSCGACLFLLFDDRGDVPQAITQQRRVLAIRDQLPDPSDRAISHNNLVRYLEGSGVPSAIVEAPRHQLAALVYQVVSRLAQHLQTTLRNYAIVLRRAWTAGTEPAIPRLAELLADPAFRPLDDRLRWRGADVNEVQAGVDQVPEGVRQAALKEQQ
jgi:hypothetical protein